MDLEIASGGAKRRALTHAKKAKGVDPSSDSNSPRKEDDDGDSRSTDDLKL